MSSNHYSPANKKIYLPILLAFALGAAVFVGLQSARPSKYDDFAKCLTEKGATFYGAFWCPHCQNQKKIFGSAKKYLNYVECSTADGNGQLPTCNKAGIESYPTWDFGNEIRITGELSLSALAEQTNCQLP